MDTRVGLFLASSVKAWRGRSARREAEHSRSHVTASELSQIQRDPVVCDGSETINAAVEDTRVSICTVAGARARYVPVVQGRTVGAVFKRSLAFSSMAACLLASASLRAEQENSWASNVTFENDLFFGTDRSYTNGVQLEVKRRFPNQTVKQGDVVALICVYVGCEGQPLLLTRHKAGQLMYTPEILNIRAAQPADRPWGGMLYYSQEHDFVDTDENVLTTLTGQIGIIGPSSFAEHTQKWVHRTFTGVQPLGWDNQIGGEVGILAGVERRYALSRLRNTSTAGVDFNTTGFWRAAVGNIATFVGAGLKMQVGGELSPIAGRGPGIDVKVLRPERATTCLVDWLTCSAGAAVEVRWMLRNVFLDGTMFRGGPRVNSRPIVVEASVSGRLDFPRTRTSVAGPWFVQFRATRRSPEFESVKRVTSQSFGALTVGTEF